MPPRVLIGVVLTLALCLPCAPCAAKDVHVATNGSDDTGDGSLANPYATIQHALYHGVGVSDDVFVRDGTYAFGSTVWVENTGTAQDPFTIQPFPGEHVILDGVNFTDGTVISIGGQHVVIQGFEVRNSSRTGITIWGGSWVQVLDNTIHDCQNGGIWVGYENETVDVTQNVIRGNTVYHNCLMNEAHTASEGWPVGIGAAYPSTHTLIEQNTVYENHGEGIGCCCSKFGTVRDNVVYDCFSVGIYLDNSQDTLVERNLVYTTMNSDYFRYDNPFNGLQVANESYDEVNAEDRSIRNIFRNNVVLGARHAFSYGSYQEGGGFIDSLALNNTFHDPILAVFNIDADSHSNSTVANNICNQPDGGDMFSSGSDITNVGFHHNLWHGSSAGSGAGAGDVAADPRLQRPNGNKAEGCKLHRDSPAINAAEAGLSPADDHGNRSRDDSPDMGAWEFISPEDLPRLPWRMLLLESQ